MHQERWSGFDRINTKTCSKFRDYTQYMIDNDRNNIESRIDMKWTRRWYDDDSNKHRTDINVLWVILMTKKITNLDWCDV